MKINSYHHYIITTNEENPIKTDKNDRRKVIIRSSNELIKNVDYFKKMYKIMENSNIIRTCLDYFKNHDISKFEHEDKPSTEYHHDLQQMAITAPQQWLMDFTISNMKEPKIIELIGSEIYNRFVLWCNANNKKYDTDASKLALKLTNLKIDGLNKGRHTTSGNTKYFDIEKLVKLFDFSCLVE
jgi:hypothetical protein